MRNCLICGKETENKKFCSSSCSSKRIGRVPRKVSVHICLTCGKETTNKLYCSILCSSIGRIGKQYSLKEKQTKLNKTSIKNNQRLCAICGKQIGSEYSVSKKYCEDCKKSYKISRASQNLNDANRQSIRKHARLIMTKLRIPKLCGICGYDKHVEVCHIKPVRSFEKDTLLSEVNSPNNLVFLCPNCHWELDEGLLTTDNLVHNKATAPASVTPE